MTKHLRPMCGHCVYWVLDQAASTPTVGHCHRFPPGIYIMPENGTVVQKFPSLDHHQWCGEWSGDETRFAEAVKLSVAQSVRGE